MIKAILFKEWIKTRWYFLLLLACSISLTIYALMRIGRVVTFKGADHLWTIMITRDNTFVEQIAYLPLICGIIIAVAQFVPEMVQKRLKLTLHLPFPQRKMMFIMLLIGVIELILLFAVQVIMISCYASNVVPPELIFRMLLTATPWFFSGFTAYLFMSAICIEPTWKMKVIYLLLMGGALRLFFLSDVPEAYNGMLIIFAILIVLYFTLTFRSVIRFKEGCQD